jgi:hypothetical protein
MSLRTSTFDHLADGDMSVKRSSYEVFLACAGVCSTAAGVSSALAGVSSALADATSALADVSWASAHEAGPRKPPARARLTRAKLCRIERR